MSYKQIYYCVICQRGIVPQVVNGNNIYVHDNVKHPDNMTFDEEENIQ